MGKQVRIWALFLVGLMGILKLQADFPPRTPWNTSKVVGSPEPPAPARVERVFPRLKFPEPSDLLFDPVTRHWFVALVGGKLVTFPNSQDPDQFVVAGDLKSQHTNLSQFLGFTLHPGFATNRFLFAVFNETHDKTNRWVMARYTVATNATPQLELRSETLIITSKCGGHDGAAVKFGPDGMIYASLGDGSSPEPPDAFKTGQDLSDLMSSIIRLDVDHPAPGQNYSVPSDNPFIHRKGARPEVWAYGFRNPWRMNFGPDGALWVGDVGWELWEMIHRVTPGYNGGWSFVEGPQAVNASQSPPTPIHPPISLHGHHEASSITGGLFYGGRRMPAQRGAYVYGDYATGKIWALRNEGERMVSRVELCDTSVQIVGFAEDDSGEIVMLDFRGDGGIYRLIPNNTTDNSLPFPRKLSETGIFTEVRTQTPSPGVLSYRINAEMWSDHATSERWIGIPGTNRWHNGSLPVGSVLVKTLSMEMEKDNPRSRRRLETQMLHSGTDGWQAYTYRWNESQTDAELVPSSGEVISLTVKDASEPGGIRQQNWKFGSRSECLRCHNPWSGTVLGLAQEQLHKGKSEKDSALLQFMAAGVVTFDTPPKLPEPWPSPYDASAPVDQRARVWLHLNCAPCHRFGAGGSVASFFNIDAKVEDLRLINQIPTRGTFALEEPRVLVKGHPERSVLWFRVNTEGQGHMPHIGSRLVDARASNMLAEWIESMPPEGAPVALQSDSTSRGLANLRTAQRDPSRLPDFLTSARNSTNSFYRDLAARFLPVSQRRQTLGSDFKPQQVLDLTGDPVRGKQLFHGEGGPQCSRCHVMEGQGRNYGPDLTQIRSRYDKATLLDHIMQPSKLVAPEYELHLVETKDGRSLAGFISRTGKDAFQLRVESGETMRLTQQEIVTDSKSPQSAMPEGLLDSLTAQEAADLMAYLTARR